MLTSLNRETRTRVTSLIIKRIAVEGKATALELTWLFPGVGGSLASGSDIEFCYCFSMGNN